MFGKVKQNTLNHQISIFLQNWGGYKKAFGKIKTRPDRWVGTVGTCGNLGYGWGLSDDLFGDVRALAAYYQTSGLGRVYATAVDGEVFYRSIGVVIVGDDVLDTE